MSTIRWPVSVGVFKLQVYGDWWGYWTLVIFKGRGGKICKNRDSNECLVGGSSALLKSPWTMKWPDKEDDHLFWQFCEGILMTFSDGSFVRHLNLINVQAERGFAAKAFFCNVFSKGGWEEGAMDHWRPKRFNSPLATDLLSRHKSSASFFLTIVSRSNVF